MNQVKISDSYENQNNEAQKVEKDSELKQFVVEYVGKRLNPENDCVTVDMVLDVFAEEFPEFLQVLAEENYFRGYEDALQVQKELELLEKERVECEKCD